MMLQQYLEQLGEKPYLWAKRHVIPKSAVYRHLAGKPTSYANANLISNASGNVVTVPELMQPPAEDTHHGDAN